MQTRPLLHALMAFAATSLIFACADNEQSEPGADEVGDGDGDGEPAGDGDGEPAGDGDGEPAGDGDGEPAGDGDGEPAGDGDGESAEECQTTADLLAPDIAQPDGGCTVIVRFDYATLAPIAWNSHCAPYPDTPIKEDEARKLSDCCSDGQRLGPEDEDLYLIYSKPDPEGGITVVSNHLAERSFEATVGTDVAGEIKYPDKWMEPEKLGSGCAAEPPPGVGYDLMMDGADLDPMLLDAVLAAFADTALTGAIKQNGMIRRTVTLAYSPMTNPGDPPMAEYVMIVESGT